MPPNPQPHANRPSQAFPDAVPRRAKHRLPTTFCLLILLAGCSGPQPDDNGTSGQASLAGVKLRLAVVGDPELAAAVGQLRGEWHAQTGSELEVESITEEAFRQGDPPAADALICPSYELGPLAERKLLAAIPDRALQGNAGDWSDIFEMLRRSEATWVEEVLAVPFGSPVFTCYYRADLLKKLDRKPPETWAQYQELAELLADRKNLGDAAPEGDAPWSGTVEPLGPGWAGLVLLARAAPYAKHRDNYSTLFDVRTMEPLVAGPPFVRALEELVAAAKTGAPELLQVDPTDARAAFWRGECGMALTWPTAAAGLPEGTSPTVEAGFAELPGSAKVFDVRKRSWETRAEDDDPRVPLLSVAGRIGVVTRKSAHTEAALQLVFWLSGQQFGPRVCASSASTTLLRQSQRKVPQRWVEEPISPRAAAQYGAVTERTFSRGQWVVALRIPGRREYLAALDEAVQGAVRGDRSPGESLQQVATRWQEITDRLGPDRQKAAYFHSLGSEP